MKRDIDNWAKAFESTKVLLHCPKISRTLVHKRLKTGPDFLPTLTILFHPSPSHTLYVALTWRRTATLDETALVRLQLRFEAPKDVASGGLEWQ